MEDAKEIFRQALDKICPTVKQVITILRGLAHKSYEIERDFAFSLNAAIGVTFASASTDANYKVMLRSMHAQRKLET